MKSSIGYIIYCIFFKGIKNINFLKFILQRLGAAMVATVSIHSVILLVERK